MKLQYDQPLSNFAFNFNLRRYSTDAAAARKDRARAGKAEAAAAAASGGKGAKVAPKVETAATLWEKRQVVKVGTSQ